MGYQQQIHMFFGIKLLFNEYRVMNKNSINWTTHSKCRTSLILHLSKIFLFLVIKFKTHCIISLAHAINFATQVTIFIE